MRWETRMRVRGAFAVNRPVMVSNLLEAPELVLVNRARRILTDGRQHSRAAVVWACTVTGTPFTEEDADTELLRTGDSRPVVFTLRELSLGAMPSGAPQ